MGAVGYGVRGTCRSGVGGFWRGIGAGIQLLVLDKLGFGEGLRLIWHFLIVQKLWKYILGVLRLSLGTGIPYYDQIYVGIFDQDTYLLLKLPH